MLNRQYRQPTQISVCLSLICINNVFSSYQKITSQGVARKMRRDCSVTLLLEKWQKATALQRLHDGLINITCSSNSQL